MKICFEGSSGIGKTTISRIFEKDYLVIPAVNELFKGEKNEGELWYYKKQVERYQYSKTSDKVIFDGDIFQPLWYGWSYNYPKGYLSLKEVYHFYQREIEQGNILFPDLYVVFNTSVENLRKRKEKDKTRRRSNFEKHLKLTRTQPKYFGFMKQQFPELVAFIEFDSIIQVKSEVESIVAKRGETGKYDSEQILQILTDWLAINKA